MFVWTFLALFWTFTKKRKKEQEGNDLLDQRLLNDIVVLMVIKSVANYELNDELITSSFYV